MQGGSCSGRDALASCAQPAVLLVLLTGLPAAGKTTFLRRFCASAATQHVTDTSTCSDVRVAGVYMLDDYLATAVADDKDDGDGNGSNNSNADGACSFTPDAWHAATRAMYDDVRTRLRQLVHAHEDVEEAVNATAATMTTRVAQLSLQQTPLLLVEDNMHYYSMRERYWRLCHADSAASPHTGAWVAMLELYFDVPLSVCLQRNAQRRHAVPAHVLHAMHARTDARHMYSHGDGDATCAGDVRHGWWLSPVAQPWLLAVLRDRQRDDDETVAAAVTAHDGSDVVSTRQSQLCDSLTTLLHSSAFLHALRAQGARRAAVAAATRHTAHESAAAASSQTCVARRLCSFDLELRACVAAFYAQLRSSSSSGGAESAATSATLRTAVQRAKQACMTHVRAQLTRTRHTHNNNNNAKVDSSDSDDDSDDAVCARHMTHFYTRLHELLAQQHATS